MSQLNDRNAQAPSLHLGDVTFPDPTQRAMFQLVHRGVLIVDDEPSQLRALHDVCTNLLEIPERNIQLIHVNRLDSMLDIAATLERALREHFHTTGHPFASIITDYNFTTEVNSIDVWKAVEARLTEELLHHSWLATGRVLVTAHDRDRHIMDAQQSGLFDAYLHKPLKIAALSAALCDSVLKRSA